jgi:plasmid stabilization system protein ParE
VTIRWSREARDDVDRLVDFIAVYDPDLANEIEQELARAPRNLLNFPRRGARLTAFTPQEVRELRIRRYVLRYELVSEDIIVLRFFHAREER